MAKDGSMSEQLTKEEQILCPSCAEFIKRDAIACRFCGKGLSHEHFRPCSACGEMIRKKAERCRFCRQSAKPGESPTHSSMPTNGLPEADEAWDPDGIEETIVAARAASASASAKESKAGRERLEAGHLLEKIANSLPKDDPARTYISEIAHIAPLCTAEEVDLARREARGGDDGAIARRELVQANLQLVVAEAKEHANQGFPFLDLIQHGNLGLIRAIEKYEYSSGHRFSTYASFWIRQAITAYMAEEELMKRPSNKVKGARELSVSMPIELLRKDISEVMLKARLSTREQDVLKLRYGLDDGRQRTAKELGELFALSCRRVGEIESTALRKIKRQL
jgi:RNA polymerase sigma factor (sigma-70 family)